VQIIPLDGQSPEGRYQFEPADRLTPEKLYDRSWAAVLLERVLHQLRREYEGAGKRALFDAIRGYLDGDRGQAPYVQAARNLGLGESAFKMSVLRMRRRYGELLRLEIGHTVADPGEVEEEIRALFTAVG
jgi:RNA polymerase sigma-70 factor (ECF subfamily)